MAHYSSIVILVGKSTNLTARLLKPGSSAVCNQQHIKPFSTTPKSGMVEQQKQGICPSSEHQKGSCARTVTKGLTDGQCVR